MHKINFTTTVLALLMLLVSSGNSVAQVMLMGTFHFSNPSLDLVKSEVMNVMSPESQSYLENITEQISQFKPTAIMLEFNPDNTDKINQQYQGYLAGTFELPVNEIYQIGFRVAKLSGVKTLLSLDERSIEWQAENLFEYMKNHDPETEALMEAMIESLSQQSKADQQNLNLKALMLKYNDPVHDQKNKSLYLLTNAVGVDDGFSGADSAASWWHRNFRIYAKIQHQALAGHRVFALAGQGHVAILKDLLKIDPRLAGEDVIGYLEFSSLK